MVRARVKNKKKDGVMQVGKGCVYEKSKGKMKSLICLGGLMFLTTAVM